MNNDNEKDILNVNPEEETSAVNADEVSDTPQTEEETCAADAEAEVNQTEAEQECTCGCCHSAEEDDTLLHAESDCASCLSHASFEAPKKRAIVTPIIIAAASFLLVAALVFGGVFVYKAFFGSSLKGVWIEKGYEDSGIYFEFDDDGNVYLRGGGINYYGTYETAVIDTETESELPEIVKTVTKATGESGKFNVFKSEFYMFGMYGGELVYSVGSADGEKIITFNFADANGNVSEMVLVKTKLPELNMDPNVITNASADEAGIKTLEIDNNIIGTWSEPDYGTYTFFEDGTAKYKTNYQIDQSYAMFYGITMGYGVDLDFKYTVKDGKIYMSVDYFTGESNDGVMIYALDGKNLVIDGVGYAKAE